ncbi:MAG TPA: hypothetical protein VF458_08605 [Ktedonobacteraceae bacterium]
MAQTTVSRCDCCGQAVDYAQFELCPVCQYPVHPAKERQFLESSIHNLQRVARYGGALIKVIDLMHRYEARLHFLRSLTAEQPAATAEQVAAEAAPRTRPFEEAGSEQEPVTARLVGALASAEAQPALVTRAASSAPLVPVTPAPVMPVAPAASMRGFAFTGDAMVNVLAAVGGFLVLAGVLGTVFVTPNFWLAFLVVLGVHAAFGGASLLTRRSALLRAVSPLYTIIFALLVPLVAFSAYRLVANNLVALSVPYLLALSALYATIIYAILAVVQRFVPFAYLGCVALLVGDLALAQAFNLAYWWWPVLALALPLLGLLALPPISGRDLFAEQRAILRTPLLALMYTVMGCVALLAPVMLLMNLSLDNMSQRAALALEPRVALLVLSCLVVLWYSLWLWRTRSTQWVPLLAYLCLATFLLLGYALNLDLAGYVLLETGVALFYHAFVRAARGRLSAFGFPGRTLDGLALGLVALVLVQTSALVPLQLLTRTFYPAQQPGTIYLFATPFTPDAGLAWNLCALGLCLLVSLDMALARAGFSRKPAQAGWCWLLALSGLLLSALYGQEVLLWQVYPLWAFLALTLGLLACAVLIRRLASPAWAYPLELLTLTEMVFTLFLSLSQPWSGISGLLLGFAALVYIVALGQRRPLHSLLSAALLLLASGYLSGHLSVLLVLGLLLPLLVAGLCRAGLFKSQGNQPMELFAWSLLGPALIFGLVVSGVDMSHGQSVFANWSADFEMVKWWRAGVPVGYEIALLGIAWYGAALLARRRAWLVPATLFGLLAVLEPTNNFWTLGVLAPGLALLAVLIGKRTNEDWALPFNLLALASAGMLVFTGFAQEQVAALSWFLLSYALLAYGIGLLTDSIAAPVLTPVFATLGMYIAASQLGDLYRPPLLALLGAGAGLAAGQIARGYGHSRMRYALPFYSSALAAAVLTGIYGSLGDLSRPFYGAIPDALFIYALVASAVVWIERRAQWSWLVAVFACWGVLASQRLTAWYVLDAGVALALAGLLSAQLTRRALSSELAATRSVGQAVPLLSEQPVRVSWLWHWPWYSAFLLATLVLGSWPLTTGQALASTPVVPGMFIFTLLALVIMLERRAPELLPVPVILAVWSIALWLYTDSPAALVVALTLLCVLIYAGQFVWRLWPANTYRLPASILHHLFSLGGLCLVLLFAASQGAVSSGAGMLGQAGVLALVTLSVLLLLYGQLHPTNVMRELPIYGSELTRVTRQAEAQVVRHWCLYSVGALLSLAVSWELLLWGQTRFDVLSLVPASYLIVVAPFILRDQALPGRRGAGQWAALLGAALLLLPTLWFSFVGTELQPTLLLLGEALLLLLLGLVLRIRIFILSSAALIIVGTMRLLFISMPPSVPILLVVFGGLLMALATALILSRHSLQAAWSRWE